MNICEFYYNLQEVRHMYVYMYICVEIFVKEKVSRCVASLKNPGHCKRSKITASDESCNIF